jgi:sulfite exporter TauE/SafE
MITAISAGFALGLLGSLHCVGMCGPLSLALPVHQLSLPRKAGALLLYHLGRIITYALIGLAFGLAGRRLYLAGMQQTVSVILGVIMVLAAVQYFLAKRAFTPAFIKKYHIAIQYRMAGLLTNTSWKNYLLLGSFNGLLPCGMVYVAVAGAMSTNSVTQGVLLMGSFGLATLPAMLALGFSGYLISPGMRSRFRKLSPYIICVAGIMLILRGMGLGIPFISPVMQSAPAASVSCH